MVVHMLTWRMLRALLMNAPRLIPSDSSSARRGAAVFVTTIACATSFNASPQTAASADSAARTTLPDLPRSTRSVSIDGRLGDEIWEDALVIELDLEIFPDENTPA